MAQLTLYLPDELEKQLREQARRSKKSLSAYVAELAARAVRPTAWPRGFAQLYGSWEGDLPQVEELPLEEREPL